MLRERLSKYCKRPDHLHQDKTVTFWSQYEIRVSGQSCDNWKEWEFRDSSEQRKTIMDEFSNQQSENIVNWLPNQWIENSCVL